MNRFRDPQWGLALLFLFMVAGVPLLQTLMEIRQGEGVRAFDLFNQRPTAANLRAYERNLETANWAAQLSRPWLQFARFAWLGDGGDKVAIGKDGWYFFKPGLKELLARTEHAGQAKTTNDPVATIVDFRDQLAALGIRLLVVPAPNKESIYPDQLAPKARFECGMLAPRTRDFLERLRQTNVEVVDLFQELGLARQQSGSARPPPLYLAQDTHWSPDGVEIAAKAVARRLLELGWIEPGCIEYREQPAPVQRLGDILRMLQVPRLERSITPETVSAMQVVRHDTGELYKDAGEAEILVLGDSFMRIYQQDPPTAAGFVAHLAKELKQPLMALINDGGGATLVRQELRARPAFLKHKKVVVWEFVERDLSLALEGWRRVPLATSSSSKPAE